MMARVHTVAVAPHPFKRLKGLDNLWREARCVRCLLSEQEHPTSGWAPARAYGDRRVHAAAMTEEQ